jgi:protocatechuate 3,4-dioxygenase, alpha subunit
LTDARPAAVAADLDEPTLALTPSQTVGPFLHIGLAAADLPGSVVGPNVVPPDTPDRVVISGFVVDGDGAGLPDALVETWQADPTGRFASAEGGLAATAVPGFVGFGRAATGQDGGYAIATVKPGRLPTGDGGYEAPHLTVSVFARGLLDRVVTRIYFADEEAANATDPVLASLPEPERAATLMATPTAEGYRFDVYLQGERETIFFDV